MTSYFSRQNLLFNASIGTTLWCVRANNRDRTHGRRRSQRELCLKVLFPVHCSNFVIYSTSRSEWKVRFNIGMRGMVVWDVNFKCFVRFSRPLHNPLKFGQFTSLSGRRRQKKCVKKQNASARRAGPFFRFINRIILWRSRSRSGRPCVNSLLLPL